MNKYRACRYQGFSLVEIMVVVVIIGLLAAAVGPTVIGRLEQARVESTKGQIANLEQALDLYKLDHSKYPSTSKGLEALLEKGKAGEPYLKGDAVPKDAWGRDFEYRKKGRKYEITSLGADGQEGGEEFDADISSSTMKSKK